MANTVIMNKQKKTMILGVVCLICVIITAVVLMQLQKSTSTSGKGSDGNTSESSASYRQLTIDGKVYDFNTKLISILCLGVDSTNPENQGQSDVIDLLIFDRENKRMEVLSISRDAMVDIRLFDPAGRELGWDKQHLALAYSYGHSKSNGALLSADAVSKMLHDIPIVYYAVGDLDIISKVQEVVGELTVVVPDDSLSYLGPQWSKGTAVTLHSTNVETFLRSRNTDMDFSNSNRMQRQKAYIEAYVVRLKELLAEDFDGTLTKLAKLYASVDSNVSLQEISAFAEMALEYTFDEDSFHIAPGEDESGFNHDEFKIDEEALNKLVLDLFYKERER